MTQFWPEMKALEGQRVMVTLSHEPLVEVVGTLVNLDKEGEVVVDTETGRRYGWPALEIVPVEVD